jgi:hypothetical protein
MHAGGRPSEYVIYGLYVNNSLIYIGQTIKSKIRYNQHCSLSNNRGNRKINKYLYNLILAGGKPEMRIIEIVESKNKLNEKEKYWIKFYRDIDLLNMTEGGTGGINISRAKLNFPWGNHHSPIQRIIKSMKETQRFFSKMNNVILVKKLDGYLIRIAEIIKEKGRNNINLALWNKYGKYRASI